MNIAALDFFPALPLKQNFFENTLLQVPKPIISETTGILNFLKVHVSLCHFYKRPRWQTCFWQPKEIQGNFNFYKKEKKKKEKQHFVWILLHLIEATCAWSSKGGPPLPSSLLRNDTQPLSIKLPEL